MRLKIVLLTFLFLLAQLSRSYAKEDYIVATGKCDLGDLTEDVAYAIAHERARANAVAQGGERSIRRDSEVEDFELVKDVIVSQVNGILTDEKLVRKGYSPDRGGVYYTLKARVLTGRISDMSAKISAALKSRGRPKIAVRIYRHKSSHNDPVNEVSDFAEQDIKNIELTEEVTDSSGRGIAKQISGEVTLTRRSSKSSRQEKLLSEAEKIIRGIFSAYLHKNGFDIYDEEKLAKGRVKEGNFIKAGNKTLGGKLKAFNSVDYVIEGSIFISEPIYSKEIVDGETVDMVRYSYNLAFDFTNLATGEKIPGLIFPPRELTGEPTKPVEKGSDFDTIKENIHAGGELLAHKLIGDIVTSWTKKETLFRVNLAGITDDEFYDLFDEFIDKFAEDHTDIEDQTTDFFNNGEGILEIRANIKLNNLRRFFRKQKIIQLKMVHKDNNTISFIRKSE